MKRFISHVPFVRTSLFASASFALMAVTASAQTTVTLADTSQTTLLTATVSEQARVSVPSGASFTVTDVTGPTNSSGASVAVSNIVLATATKQLKISLQAEASSFTPPVVSAATWSAGDVSWSAGSWTSATGAAGTLSNASYNTVATCAADSAACSTSALVFTLGANTNVKRSGNHTLTVRWRIEAIGS